MAIVALGVVYGDIGTSPLYTMQTFLNGQGGLAHADREAVLGVLSLVFCQSRLSPPSNNVLIAMRIDNKGEGGIFALYSLVRKYGAWLAIPAMLGGAAFSPIPYSPRLCPSARQWKAWRRCQLLKNFLLKTSS